jgi:hypothetical protein
MINNTEWIYMSPTDIASIIAAYTGVAVVIGGIAWRLFKKAVNEAVATSKSMEEPINELRHNGGSSLLDVVKLQILPIVKELRDEQKIIGTRVTRLEGRFDQYIDDSHKE